MPTVCDVYRQTTIVMNIPPSSTGQIHSLRLQIQLLGRCGSAVQGLHIYGSVVDAAGCGGSERTKWVHRGSGRMAVRDPWPWGGGGVLRPQLQLGRLHSQLRLDFECWMSHCSVISAHSNTLFWQQQAEILQPPSWCSGQLTYVILLLTRDRVAADLSVLNGR